MNWEGSSRFEARVGWERHLTKLVILRVGSGGWLYKQQSTLLLVKFCVQSVEQMMIKPVRCEWNIKWGRRRRRQWAIWQRTGRSHKDVKNWSTFMGIFFYGDRTSEGFAGTVIHLIQPKIMSNASKIVSFLPKSFIKTSIKSSVLCLFYNQTSFTFTKIVTMSPKHHR